MAGTIKLDGTTFLSKSGSDFTLDVGNGGTIQSTSSRVLASNSGSAWKWGSGVPSGTHYQDFIGASDYGNDVPDYSTTSSSFAEPSTSITGSFTTIESSANSMLWFHFQSQMVTHAGDDAGNGEVALCLKSSSSTSHANADDLHNDQTYKHYMHDIGYKPINLDWFYKAGTRVPTNLTSYTAGQTLYWRLFIKSGGTENFKIVSADSSFYMRIQEVAI